MLLSISRFFASVKVAGTPKSTANSTDIAVLAVEGVIFKRNGAAGSICAAVELLRVGPCRFSGAPVRSSV